MKKIFKSIVLPTLACLLVAFGGCKPDEIGEIMEPLARTEGIKGNWAIESVSQIDEIANSAGEANYSQELTEQFGFDALEFGFTDTGFVIQNPENAPFFVPLEGSWAFDNAEYPTKILLTEANASEATAELALNRVPAAGHKLELKFQRFDESGKLYLSYLYILNRVEE